MSEFDRCSVCTRNYHCIPFDGPEDARVMILGERPGQWEEKNAQFGYSRYGHRKCFIGPTGDEFNVTYLSKQAHLDRDDCRVGNVVRCGADSNKTPTEKEIHACGGYWLPDELKHVNPDVLILQGASACKLVPGLDLNVEHGIPRRIRLYGWEGWGVGMWHPASGMHDTSKMVPLLEDWEQLGQWLRGGLDLAMGADADPWPDPDYWLLETVNDLDEYVPFYNPDVMCIDTESHARADFSVQFSWQFGTGRMILVSNKPVLKAWVEIVDSLKRKLDISFHNAPADLPVCARAGLEVLRYRDTMQEAYQLVLPQSLKVLGYRLCGVRMKSWDDLVTEPSKEALFSWMLRYIKQAETHWRQVEERVSEKTGRPIKPKLHISEEEKTLLHVQRFMLTNPKYKPWEKLRELGPDSQRWHDLLKLMPLKGIGYVPLQEAVEYGCRDADIGLRIARLFERLRKEESWDVQEEDQDEAYSCRDEQTERYVQLAAVASRVG